MDALPESPEDCGEQRIDNPVICSAALLELLDNFIAVFDESFSLDAADGEAQRAFLELRDERTRSPLLALRHKCAPSAKPINGAPHPELEI